MGGSLRDPNQADLFNPILERISVEEVRVLRVARLVEALAEV